MKLKLTDILVGGNVATLIILILVILLPAGIAEYGRYKGWWY